MYIRGITKMKKLKNVFAIILTVISLLFIASCSREFKESDVKSLLKFLNKTDLTLIRTGDFEVNGSLTLQNNGEINLSLKTRLDNELNLDKLNFKYTVVNLDDEVDKIDGEFVYTNDTFYGSTTETIGNTTTTELDSFYFQGKTNTLINFLGVFNYDFYIVDGISFNPNNINLLFNYLYEIIKDDDTFSFEDNENIEIYSNKKEFKLVINLNKIIKEALLDLSQITIDTNLDFLDDLDIGLTIVLDKKGIQSFNINVSGIIEQDEFDASLSFSYKKAKFDEHSLKDEFDEIDLNNIYKFNLYNENSKETIAFDDNFLQKTKSLEDLQMTLNFLGNYLNNDFITVPYDNDHFIKNIYLDKEKTKTIEFLSLKDYIKEYDFYLDLEKHLDFSDLKELYIQNNTYGSFIALTDTASEMNAYFENNNYIIYSKQMDYVYKDIIVIFDKIENKTYHHFDDKTYLVDNYDHLSVFDTFNNNNIKRIESIHFDLQNKMIINKNFIISGLDLSEIESLKIYIKVKLEENEFLTFIDEIENKLQETIEASDDVIYTSLNNTKYGNYIYLSEINEYLEVKLIKENGNIESMSFDEALNNGYRYELFASEQKTYNLVLYKGNQKIDTVRYVIDDSKGFIIGIMTYDDILYYYSSELKEMPILEDSYYGKFTGYYYKEHFFTTIEQLTNLKSDKNEPIVYIKAHYEELSLEDAINLFIQKHNNFQVELTYNYYQKEFYIYSKNKINGPNDTFELNDNVLTAINIFDEKKVVYDNFNSIDYYTFYEKHNVDFDNLLILLEIFNGSLKPDSFYVYEYDLYIYFENYTIHLY